MNDKAELVIANKTEAVEACRQHRRRKIDEALDSTEQALEEQCEKHQTEQTQKLKRNAEQFEDIERESLMIKDKVCELQQSGQYCTAFVALRQISKKLQLLKSNMMEAKACYIEVFSFCPNLDIVSTLKCTDGLIVLSKNIVMGKKDYSKMQSHLSTSIYVSAMNKDKCWISTSTLLPRGKLVIIDWGHNQVKVVDTNQNKLLSILIVDGNPFGVCKLSDSSVAVTLGNKQRVLFMDIDRSGNLCKTKEIAVNGNCKGVAVMEDKLVVTYESPDKVEIMDMNGLVYKTIPARIQNKVILSSPEYVTVSPDQTRMYVSNTGSNTVTCMSPDGTVLHEYKDVHPGQAAVDINGMVFVACSSGEVHLITPYCEKIMVLTDLSIYYRSAKALSYCKDKDRLYIGMYDCDYIPVLQLKGLR